MSIKATGSYVGDITVWDFETFRPIGYLKGHKARVTALKFVPDHPLLVSGCSAGIVCVYAVRGGPACIQNLCLGKFVNLERFGKTHMNVGVSSMLVFFEQKHKSRYMHVQDVKKAHKFVNFEENQSLES